MCGNDFFISNFTFKKGKCIGYCALLSVQINDILWAKYK